MVDFVTAYNQEWYDLLLMAMDKDGFISHVHETPVRHSVFLFNFINDESVESFYREDLDEPYRLHPYNVLLILGIDDSSVNTQERRTLVERLMKLMWTHLVQDARDTIMRNHKTMTQTRYYEVPDDLPGGLETPQWMRELSNEIPPSEFSVALVNKHFSNPE